MSSTRKLQKAGAGATEMMQEQKGLLYSSLRRLSRKLNQPEEFVEAYVKRELDLESFADLSKADASIVIGHIQYLESELVE